MLHDQVLAPYELKGKRVFVAGHRGMVGSALVRRLDLEDCEVVTVGHDLLDLRDVDATKWFFNAQRPDVVLMAAGKVGGIGANSSFQADFLHENVEIATSVIDSAHKTGVDRLIYFGSSCIYPMHAPQPITEDAILTGSLEPTNYGYAIAKLAGVKMCQAYREQYCCSFFSVMPCNLYGTGDCYDEGRSHVPAALIRRFHEAKVANLPSVTVWGTGIPRREFLHVDDLADATITALTRWDGSDVINIGTGVDIPIAAFARLIARIVGYEGHIEFDDSKPDGVYRKCLDVSRINGLGWQQSITLIDGLTSAYQDFLAHHAQVLV